MCSVYVCDGVGSSPPPSTPSTIGGTCTASTWSRNPNWAYGASSSSDNSFIGVASPACAQSKRNCLRHVLDGNASTIWHCGSGSGCWLTFDLGGRVTVSGIEILTFGGRLVSATLDISDDGVDWKSDSAPRISIPNPSPTEATQLLFPSVSGRFFRLRDMEGHTPSVWPAVSELQFLTVGVECTACAPGSFKDVNGSADCSPCARGKYSTSTAATAESTCVGCPSYTHSPDGSGMLANCTCVKGYTGPDGNSCMACDAGKHKSTNGSAPCTWCPPGKFSSSSATWCNDCPPNTNSRLGSNVVTNCTCNAGYTGPDGAACQACVAGTYKDINGSALCMRCISGKFSNATGETTGKTCKDCPANTHSEVGSGMMIHCTCNSGYTGPDGVACVACAGGTYKDGNGSAVCTLCPAGKFSTATAATSKSTCNDCPPGTYSINVIRIGAQFCTQCPPGKYSGSKAATSMSTCKACGMDTYSASNRSLCLICPLNSIAPASSIELQDCRCNAGYTGPDGGLCEACIPPTFKETNGSHACTAPEYEFFDCGIRCAIGMASTGPNPQNCNVRSACARTHTLTLQTIHT